MDGCVGRAEELEFLEKIYAKAPVACAVCGRRHLGKTSLLKWFCQGKEHIYITGTAGLKSDNLAEISRTLSKHSGKTVHITDILDLLPTLSDICKRKRTVVIIDRFSDLVENFPEFNSYLRSFMNREIMNTKMMLVVCDNDSSVFGRFYYTLDLKPMSYLECKGFHPDYTPMEHLMAYSIVGGTPAYQELIRGDPLDVVRDQFFDHMSVFSLEVEGMVSTETSVTPACSKILSAMANGCEGIRDISDRTGLGVAFCTKLLDDMEHKGLVNKETSSGIPRRSVYTICSNIIRFFYEVVYRHTHQVEFESPKDAFDMARPLVDGYMEKGFKTICMDYITCAYDYTFIGKLRRKDDSKDSVVDFVAGANMYGVKRMIVARCRLNGDPFRESDLIELMDKGKKLEGSNKLYMMFSGCGFGPDLQTRARNDASVVLKTLDDIYNG